ncbi:xylulose 5-phosphate 3-epimerase [Stutzerimonas kirkiae]|uniref:Xylulose 5-phosphate 3-epimerase n=1 Tax=Stutzerimonas kirkiae TaxID=2211392 RepID=A0A4Q9RDF8_9GAMM|nr:xylulose 5-phosphate 3-epimerase [Stutzerimonas kirkiae]TBU97971.1 xylulose 5-phosphate 3-epimerase [Stutzerimonas kirkiae]TBV04513.1 xylulose 5-phosphate 3-epimerase [Stutzerimonas kirkiae]TBV11549.1 xylulose 5-phosphate 3-epimerase [Stutzerimonas kirkiae]
MSQLLPSLAELDQHAQAQVEFATWRAGYGPFEHAAQTQAAAYRLAHQLVQAGLQPDVGSVYRYLRAIDHLASAGLWLVVHMTYARRLKLDGAPLDADDFKDSPEGHTGGALNMVPAYAGYLGLNALTGRTRGWLMGQGHCVAAIDALNVLLGNLHPEQAEAYSGGEQGLNRLLSDFYGYRQANDGSPRDPLGSHVNAHTAGGIAEGGYLGFAELQYAHIPLPGETLVAFLSDGAAEEQRGSDWIPRWWRAEDCGAALPVMIANGRRIEQRTQLGTLEGLEGFRQHLSQCGFDPISFDGRDPAAFICTLWEMEHRLARRVEERQRGILNYPLPIPYGIAETVKGFGFYGAGSNAAHNLPLPGNPQVDGAARALFNEHAARLFVPQKLLAEARELIEGSRRGRSLERDNAMALRRPRTPDIPELHYRDDVCSPMAAVDRFFVDLTQANPDLRARVGNPDELASNRLGGVLKALKHRVTDPESELEAVDGRIITALNEEAVVSACLANQGGLNLVASYEAFCVKMLGAVRQSIIFSRQQKEVGRPAGWLGWPLIATSHTWENGKNQQSHQDTTFCEALLGEMSDTVRVLFPADHNSALALLPSIYSARGELACMVVPKRERPAFFSREQAEHLARDGAILVREYDGEEPVLLIANGSYQLSEMLRAAQRLEEAQCAYRLVYLQEPGRFRAPRDRWEDAVLAGNALVARLFPERMETRILLTHMRPEVARGHLWTLLPDARKSSVLGYRNRGGTLDEIAMQFVNRACWANVLAACARLRNVPRTALLTPEEAAAVAGKGDPAVLR